MSEIPFKFTTQVRVLPDVLPHKFVSGGHPAMLFDRRAGGGLVIAQTATGAIQVQTSSSANDLTTGSTTFNDNNWHQVAVVYNQTNGESLSVYVDGVLDITAANTADWSWASGQEIELGLSHDNFWQVYNGLLDDVRFYNRELTATEVTSVFSTGALVDNNALVMRLNFDTAPTTGLSLSWRATDVILQSAGSAAGPYTDTPAISSPYVISFKGASEFYRYHGHSPTNIISNPFFM